ncbi:uncharacterized protein [Amphiura filiformis]|uniref:uncharacterized protein n=1 Tax=Amphiura filiformis TaxID=82378 RepID=UPI003B220D1E
MKGSTEDCPDVVITTPVDPPPATSPQARNAPKPPKLKSVGDAYVLGISPLGILGIHHFYLGSVGLGLAYFFTLGCGGIGWITDWFRMPMLVKDANRKIERKWKMDNEETAFKDADAVRYELDTKRLSDCYVLGFPPAGLLGFHHFYLRRPGWGILYFLTLGLFGCGMIMDLFRMSVLHKRYKTKLKLKAEGKDDGYPEERHLDDAYALGFPLGLLGFHHFYLKRPCWGMLYLFTFGMLGIGFLIDLCRMKSLVDDANRRIRAKAEQQKLVHGQNGQGSAINTTSQDTTTYTTPPSNQQANHANGPPGAPESYQAPYSYPYPNSMPPVPGQQPYPAPPPPQAGEGHPMGAPPPYTAYPDMASAMPDPDGIPVEKAGMSGPEVATDANDRPPSQVVEEKKD